MKTNIILKNARLAFGIATALSLATAQAQVESITLNGQENIAFTVTNLTNVEGFGAHFSTTASTDGYGGAYAECHLISGSVGNPGLTVVAYCYDGYLDQNNHANEYQLNLGAKKRSDDGRDKLSSVTFIVSEAGVKVEAERIASNPYTNESYPYTIESTFPIRQSTGFWSTGQIYYRENSVLNERQGREGVNYVLSVAANVDPGDDGCTQAELEAAYDKGYDKGHADCPIVGPSHCTNPSYRYDPRKKIGILDLPSIDLQLLEPFFGGWSTKFDAFSAVMEEVPGTMYFRITKTQAKPDKAKPEAVAKSD
ncbi:MAG TPA: hypothetical protein EYP59_14015 [Thiotrichaceae bacterium]|nr:hypothetical protein [Thiotrichaceae bacterium]